MNNKLVLLRHGESLWNQENKFTGWVDVNLSRLGIDEAKKAGILLKKNDFSFDLVYTSCLRRANLTMDICLKEMLQPDVEAIYDWRLNERHYGSLQGLNKSETAEKFGDEQVFIWRRSYDTSPPPLDLNDKRHPTNDPKYNHIKSLLPSSESLTDTYNRLLPLLTKKILKQVKLGKKILIVAHGNSLRAIVKYLDKISSDEIVNLNIPTGQPLVYELDFNLSPIKHYYL